MQAVRAHEDGTLAYETVPDPVPADGEVLVELRCAALNRRDSYVASGTYPFPLPLIPGSDGSGVRRDTGEEAAAFPLAALTAYRALFTRARVQPNETVLVLGAGSGVSTFAVQLASQ